jgi:hypothetical protein
VFKTRFDGLHRLLGHLRTRARVPQNGETLQWYADRLAEAKQVACITFAFNIDTVFQQALSADNDVLRYIVKDDPLGEEESIGHDRDVIFAAGGYLGEGALANFLTERSNPLNRSYGAATIAVCGLSRTLLESKQRLTAWGSLSGAAYETSFVTPSVAADTRAVRHRVRIAGTGSLCVALAPLQDKLRTAHNPAGARYARPIRTNGATWARNAALGADDSHVESDASIGRIVSVAEGPYCRRSCRCAPDCGRASSG